MVWIVFITYLQGHITEFGYISEYWWKILHFMLFYTIFKQIQFKNTVRCLANHKQCTGQSKIGQSVPFGTGFGLKFPEYLELSSLIYKGL